MTLIQRIVPVLAALAFVAAAPAAAQQAPKIAVVDGNKLTTVAKAMKAAREETEKLAKKFEAEFQAEERKLQAEFDELQKRRSAMTIGDYEKRVNDIQRRNNELRRTAQIRQQQMALSVRQVQLRFRDEVLKIVKALAVEEGYTLIIDVGATLHVSPQFDITDKVLERLDKALPTIKFEFPPKIDPSVDGPPGPGPAPAAPN
jgi:outer membrane protein